ncbi:MmgE/PrpD family protein [Pigmentiphaga soli]|uniref:MmgE/PrpD family protein n=1 Tax=Pigmentiphaga soli TaxID=1007095 RepID=A0ABP8GKQ3_9BURK
MSQSETGAVSGALARFVAATRWEDIPPAVRHEAKRSLVNFFAVALAGCRDRTLDLATGVYKRFSAGEQATVIGRRERCDILTAAALNAASANVFDFDDTHIPTIAHPTAPVAPALLALAETQPMSGRDFLLAFILGVEAECRIANAVSPSHYARGWHITSTCGVFGSALAAGKIFGLEPRALVWALGSASSQAGGLVETLGTMAKSVGVGNAARNGLLSALLAREGFDGPDAPLEGVRGFLNVTSERARPDEVDGALGQRWEILANTYKPYPCGVVLNPVIEACLELARRPELAGAAGRIEDIEITGHSLLRQRTDRPGVRTGREAQVSAQHAVAVSLVRGKAGLPEFTDQAVADPALRALGAKVRFRDDDSFAVEAARVAVRLAGAEPIVVSIEAARGGPKRPLSDADLEAKLRELCRGGGSGVEPEALIQAVWALDERDDVGSLMKLAAGVN